jgi:putative membrane protein
MKRLLIRLLINTVALYIAITLLNGRGITPQSENWLSLLWLALIFGIINAVIKPVLMVVGCPFLVLTLGLGGLLINTLLFWLAGYIGQTFHVGFSVDGFWPALFGAIIVSIVSVVLNIFIHDDPRERKPR